MISRDNYSEAHIREIQKQSKADPVLIERTLYAFGLLEELEKVGLDFIFKGGTSLMLMLPEPRRLSTDIDIVVNPETDIEKYIKEASEIFPFQEMHEQKRVGRNNIVKRHFKFTYNSPIRNSPFYILLDVLFEENHYKRLVKKNINNSIILSEGEAMMVTVPTADCLLGDKMTAFAPHTTGIPVGIGKDLEVIKQFYDVGTLIEVFDNFDDLRQTYYDVSQSEIKFRGNRITSEDALLDTIRSAACIGSRGKYDKEEFHYFLDGTRQITDHILEHRRYNMEVASMSAPKIIYMAACLLTGKPYEKEIDADHLINEKLTQTELMDLKTFRRTQKEKYGYLVLADRLLQEYRKHKS